MLFESPGLTGRSFTVNGPMTDLVGTGFNDRARSRAIVMHGAWYVNPDLIRTQGRLGRSQGIFPGLNLHHQAGSAAEGAIVHRLVTVVGVITQLPAVQLQQPLLHRTTGNAVFADGGKHLREQGNDLNSQASHASY